MFEVEKPRRFHYEPRFYDPEKEKWEALKKKYAIEQERKEAQEGKMAGDDDLQYFEQRLKDLDKEERANASKLTWRDLFRKREMPRFHYQPRFVDGIDTKATTESGKEQLPQNDDESLADKYRAARHQIKIKRRFDISDSEYMKPISGTKIILYCFIVFLLISLIIAF